jgi:lambda family phage portal protein
MIRRVTNWLLGLLARYEGAQWSADRSYLSAGVQSARFDADSSTRTQLVRKSRYFERNSALYNRMADLFESYTVGTGLVCQPASSDLEWNIAAKGWWDQWCKFPDLTSLQPFGTLQSLVARTWFVDGEVFILKMRGRTNNPRIALVEGHLIATPDAYREDPRVIDGIRVDDRGRPEAYYIGQEDLKTRRIVFGNPTPASDVIHVFEPGRPGQYRGLPFVYPVINLLHDLDDLQILEMRRAKKVAGIADVIKNSKGEANVERLRQQSYNATTTTSLDTTATESRVKYINDVLGGKTLYLKPNEDYIPNAPNLPSVSTREYWRLLMSQICLGCGFPFVIVDPDSMQGTVYRGSLDMANAFFRARSSIVAAAVEQIYGYVMGSARYLDLKLNDSPDDYWRVSIQPPRAVNVDVGRNSTAMLQELAAGATTWEQHYSSLGLDWREQFNRLKEQQDYAKSIGLNLSFPGQAAPQQAAPQPDPEDIPS